MDSYLDKDGWSGTEKGRLLTTITEAASIRLVFLTSRTEGQLSFEVRSLQEHMAAECVMAGLVESVLNV